MGDINADRFLYRSLSFFLSSSVNNLQISSFSVMSSPLRLKRASLGLLSLEAGDRKVRPEILPDLFRARSSVLEGFMGDK